jgi:hypothetical protein
MSVPALAVVCPAGKTNMVTSSNVSEGLQSPLLMVQRNTYVPTIRLLKLVVGLVAVNVGVLGPLMSVHTPVAGESAAFAPRVTEFAGVQID